MDPPTPPVGRDSLMLAPTRELVRAELQRPSARAVPAGWDESEPRAEIYPKNFLT